MPSRRQGNESARVSAERCRFCGVKISVERMFLVILLTLYLGFSLWTWQLVPQSDDSTNIYASNHHQMGPTPQKTSSKVMTIHNPLDRLSSVDFYACCGLGHRLVRMSLAAYVSRQRNFSLRSFWGWCGERNPVEVFSYLFRPYPASEVSHVQSENQLLPFYNEVPGFPALVRRGPDADAECPCVRDKIDSDFELYRSLRRRFRGKEQVDAFVQQHFANATVLGIHVRSGNGESGDFERKGRDIGDPDAWVHQIRLLLQQTLLSRPLRRPPLLFIATDTPSMVARFRNEFAAIQVPVLDLQQEGRRAEGSGVLFGTSDKVYNTVKNVTGHVDDYSSCLQGWMDTLTDMLLLSHADVVVAARPSSFVQTLPMSMAFGKARQRRVIHDVYCEIVPKFEEVFDESDEGNQWVETDPEIQCHDSYENWCCNHSTWIKFHHSGPKGRSKIISKEFVRFPPLADVGTLQNYKGIRNRTKNCGRPKRGRAGGGWKDKCLPHVWT